MKKSLLIACLCLTALSGSVLAVRTCNICGAAIGTCSCIQR